MVFKFERLDTWNKAIEYMVIIGRRGHLERQIYRRQYQAADELAAIITGLTRAQHQG